MRTFRRLGAAVLRLWLGASGLFTLSILLIAFTPFVSWYAGRLATSWTNPDGDVLIVLSGGDLSAGFPSEDTMIRCLYAVRAFRAGHYRQVVVSGYQTARHMRLVLAAEGVPDQAIVVDDAPRSTRQSALSLARLLQGTPGTRVLLTSDYHMFRASRAFRKAGLPCLPYPVADARKRATWRQRRWAAFTDEAIETVKIVYYFVHGWI